VDWIYKVSPNSFSKIEQSSIKLGREDLLTHLKNNNNILYQQLYSSNTPKAEYNNLKLMNYSNSHETKRRRLHGTITKYQKFFISTINTLTSDVNFSNFTWEGLFEEFSDLVINRIDGITFPAEILDFFKLEHKKNY